MRLSASAGVLARGRRRAFSPTRASSPPPLAAPCLPQPDLLTARIRAAVVYRCLSFERFLFRTRARRSFNGFFSAPSRTPSAALARVLFVFFASREPRVSFAGSFAVVVVWLLSCPLGRRACSRELGSCFHRGTLTSCRVERESVVIKGAALPPRSPARYRNMRQMELAHSVPTLRLQ